MILGLDLGSTSFKAAVFDPRLARLGTGRAQGACRRSPDGGAELDPEALKRAVREAVAGALAEAGAEPGALRSLAVTSQAQTFTVLGTDGRPKAPFISWQDERAAAACAALRAEPALADFGRQASFGQLLPALQICQLRRLRRTAPGPIRCGERVASLPAWLALLLTGELVTDDNLAAMSGLYSLQIGSWWPAALQACGLEPDQLPAVVPVGSAAGQTGPGAAALGLPAGVPLVLAGNDQTAGAFAARVHEGKRLLLTLGTAHAVYRHAAKLPPPEPGLIRGPYPGGGGYAMRADSSGGNVVDWAAALLGFPEDPSKLLDLAATAPPGRSGLAFHAELPAAAGGWTGLALGHNPAELARSVIEALAQRTAAMASQLLPPGTGAEVLLAGGGSRHQLWSELFSTLLGRAARHVDATPSLGAAAMAVAPPRRSPPASRRIGAGHRPTPGYDPDNSSST